MTFNISTYSVDKLGRYAEIQPGFAFKSERFTDDPSDVALVKGENVQQGFIDWNASKYWPAGDADTLRNFELRVGDIVLAMDRPWVTAGLKWAYIKKDDPRSLLVQRVARLRAKKGLDQNYLRCLISSDYFSNYLQPIVTGVNVPHISGKQIGDFKIPLPSYPIQQKIAAIISAYDELIENNQRRIALLEKMAEEIYREWFVRQRFPGYKHVEKLKRAPKGWREAKLGDLIPEEGLQTGKRPIGGAQDSGIPSIGAENVVGLARHDFSREKYVNEHVFVIRTRDLAAQYFLYFYLNQEIIQEYVKTINKNAAQPGINKSELRSIPILLPQSDLIQEFENVISPIISQIFQLAKTQRTLTKTRDLLLPRLISGKLSVEHLDIQFPPGMEDRP